MRRYPRVNGPAALPLFCLAPHGVFPASRIAPRAVSSYLAFSPLPDLCCQRTGGVFSVTLSVTAILQLRCPRVLRGMSPYGVRTFLQQAASGSPAIICHRRQFSMITIEEKRTADYADKSVISTCAAPKSTRALAWRFATSSNVERCLDPFDFAQGKTSARHDKN